MWKLKDRPGEKIPEKFADRTLKDRKIKNHP
jgi:hypothetical protein